MSPPEATAAQAGLRRTAAPWTISDGAIEALKWLGLVLMIADHIGKYLLNESAITFAPGRLALPLFGFVLAYNLARPDTLKRGTYKRLAIRLAITGAVATPPFIALGGLGWGWWPLNIMAALLAATLVIWTLDARGPFRRTLATLLFIVAGSMVEFWWPGIAMIIAAWYYCRHRTTVTLIAWLCTIASLAIINQNLWALAAVIPIFAATRRDVYFPRAGKWFYVLYPAHLAVIWLAKVASL